MPFHRVSEALPLENLIGKPRAGAERSARGLFPPGPERPSRSGRGNDANVSNSRVGGGPQGPATASGACKWTDVENLFIYSATARRARAGIPRNRRFYVKSRPLPCRRALPPAASAPSPTSLAARRKGPRALQQRLGNGDDGPCGASCLDCAKVSLDAVNLHSLSKQFCRSA